MKYDVMVIAGTTESRQVIESLLGEKKGMKILACVATEMGKKMLLDYDICVHVGRLDEEGFLSLLRENPCDRIIDASHPFAKVVTKTVKNAAKKMGIPCERLERDTLSYDYDGIIYVKDVNEAIRVLNEMEGNILLTTGVNTSAQYMNGVRDGKKRLYIRVLSNEDSLRGCERAGYMPEHVFGAMPPYTLEDNLVLIERTRAGILVSKDSGKTGGVDVKMEACKKAGISMVLIGRPVSEKEDC